MSERIIAFSFLGGDHEVNSTLKKLNFRGELADYANDRALLGDEIDPVHLYILPDEQGPHNVAWVHRTKIDLTDGEVSEGYHIACDCLPRAELEDDVEAMFSCRALINALFIRAAQVRGEFDLSRDAAKRKAIIRLLKRDHNVPETWPANTGQGEHLISLMSVILMEKTAVVQGYADYLASEGKIIFDDNETIRLNPDYKQAA